MLNSEMCSVRRYLKATLPCSWKNLGFMSLMTLYLGILQFNIQNTDPFPMLCLLSEIFDSIRLYFFSLSLKNSIQKFFYSNYFR